jgi:hypothetical protein
MPQIIVKQAFRFAHHGHQVEAFEPADEPVDTTDECAELAIAEGWAEAPAVQASAPPPAELPGPDTKAIESSPETRDAARQRSTKAAA